MSKTSEINREEVLRILNALEGSSTFKGRTALYEAMGRMLKVSGSHVQNLIKEYSLEDFIKTPKGKLLGKRGEVEVVARETWEKELKATFPTQKGLVRDIIGGSRASAVKLMCLDCAGHIRAEITDCPVLSCPLYSFRPYQRGEREERGEGGEAGENGKTGNNGGGGEIEELMELQRLIEGDKN